MPFLEPSVASGIYQTGPVDKFGSFFTEHLATSRHGMGIYL